MKGAELYEEPPRVGHEAKKKKQKKTKTHKKKNTKNTLIDKINNSLKFVFPFNIIDNT